MGKQEKARKNVFGTVLTDVMPSSNYRGDTEDNRSVLQKLRYADGDHTVFSAEAIRNRLREMLREDGLPSNRSRLKSQKELTVHYDKFPNANNFADSLTHFRDITSSLAARAQEKAQLPSHPGLCQSSRQA